MLLTKHVLVDTAVKLAAKTRPPGKSNPTTPKSSPLKRRISYVGLDTEGNNVEGGEDPSDETYNTRYKGVKRVKVRADPPEKLPRKVGRPRVRPRKSAQPVAHHPNDDSDASASDHPKPGKRGRGRPRKSAENVKPASKQVFDGVVLEKRHPTSQAVSELPVEEGEADGDGEVEEEGLEDLVLTAINGNGNEDLSSLGGSNKGAHIDGFFMTAKLDSQFEQRMIQTRHSSTLVLVRSPALSHHTLSKFLL